ncbi:MAG: radical SAM protein [Candidatus Gracilibacteria bacterium]|nr:radical SAM protein [Candidatus Gracilibacteria bacterium]
MLFVDIKIGYQCNNYCFFCIQGEKRTTHKAKTLQEIKDILFQEFSRGVRGVNFTGGEPTIFKTLIPAIEYAKSLGYKTIKIQSNGQTFGDLRYCVTLIKAGANLFEPSIHGYKPETHDYLVQTKGAWKKVVNGINNLKKLGQIVFINSVITKQNYKEIPLLAELLLKLNVDYFQFAFPHIGGSAKKYHEMIVPKKTEIMPYIYKAISKAKSLNKVARTEAIPFCFMKGYEYAIAEKYNPDTSIFDGEFSMSSYKNYKLNEGKAKHEKCETCIKNRVCEGPWREYPELYGWEEFTPILI